MNENDLSTLTPKLMALDTETVVSPTMPVHTFLQEAENLYTWMQTDMDLLRSLRLESDVLDGLQTRIGALRETESNWRARRHSREVAQASYDEQSAIAFALLDEVLHHMRFAYRKHPALLSRLPLPSDRSGHAEKFQIMNDLAVMGREQTELLESWGFDPARLQLMAELSDRTANLCSASEESRRGGREAKLMRDRAYTYLKMAVDEIRDAARFLFRKNPERLEGYRSEYIRKKNSKGISNSVEAEETEGITRETVKEAPELTRAESDKKVA